MFNNVALDVSIGLIFIFLLYSLLATILAEIVATVFAFRASNLETAISRMLNDEPGRVDSLVGKVMEFFRVTFRRLTRMVTVKHTGAAKEFYGHTRIKYLGENNINPLPSYIAPGTFSWVLLQLIKDKAKQGLDPDDSALPDPQMVKKYLEQQMGWLGPETRKQLLDLLEEAEYDLVKFREKIEKWFNETMGRASEWYKRKMQYVLFGIGFAIALVFNASTIEMVKHLSKDEKARAQLVELATSADNIYNQLPDKSVLDTMNLNAKLDTLLSVRKMLTEDINASREVISQGWDTCSGQGWECYAGEILGLKKFIGFILTGLAISLGAPFWFDMLNKLVKLRTGNQVKE